MFAESTIVSTTIEFLGHHLYLLGAVLSALALIYSLLALAAMLRRPRCTPIGTPPAPVTILKPLCGSDTRLYESLRSFCMLDYPQFQIVFGVADRQDPAVPVVELLRREFPKLDLQLVVDPIRHGSNPKVSNLINMMPSARHELLVIADADIQVAPDYLKRLLPPLGDLTVGIVTCAYRGAPINGLWSQVGAEFINGWFTPSVYVAAFLRSREFAFGATIALRREVLNDIGGFAAVADQLADDYRLGELTRARGLRTVLSGVVVNTTVGEATLADLVNHQLRWLRTIRCVRPVGYAMAGLTYSVPVALIGNLLAMGRLAAPWLLVATLACRLLQYFVSLAPQRRSLRGCALAVAADCALFLLWCSSFTSQRVRWRDASFAVHRDGSAVPIVRARSYPRGDAHPDHVISSGELL